MEVVALLQEKAAKLEGFAKFRLLRATPKSVCEDEGLDQEQNVEATGEEAAAG